MENIKYFNDFINENNEEKIEISKEEISKQFKAKFGENYFITTNTDERGELNKFISDIKNKVSNPELVNEVIDSIREAELQKLANNQAVKSAVKYLGNSPNSVKINNALNDINSRLDYKISKWAMNKVLQINN